MMNDTPILDLPNSHGRIVCKAQEIAFGMPSDLLVGSLLKTLVASKPSGNFLELGTGIGLSLSWMLDGMDGQSKLVSIDNDVELTTIAEGFFGHDPRLEIVCQEASAWIKKYRGKGFDLVFADAWPGKYSDLEAILPLVNIGGFYVVDDMSVQPNWPDGHQTNVDALISALQNREDFTITKMNWSTGLIVAVRRF